MSYLLTSSPGIITLLVLDISDEVIKCHFPLTYRL